MKATLRVHFNRGGDMTERWEEKVEVEFREPSPDEAPIAVESADATTRWFEGRHYRAYTLFASRDPAFRNITDAKAIVEFLETRPEPHAVGYTTNGYPDQVSPRDGYLANGYMELREESKDRKFSEKRYPDLVDEPNRVAQVAGAKRFASDCLIVDGKFWVACAEPKLVLREGRVCVDTKHRVFKKDWGNNMNEATVGIGLVASSYRLDEMEELRASALADGVEAVVPDVSIHIPESIRWDRRADNLIMAAKLLLDVWSAKDIRDVHPDIGQALVNVSRVLWQTDDEDIDIDMLGDQLSAAIKAHTEIGIGVKPYAKVCDDWFERPVSVTASITGSAQPRL